MNAADFKHKDCKCGLDSYVEKLHEDKNKIGKSIKKLELFIMGGVDSEGRRVESFMEAIRREIKEEMNIRSKQETKIKIALTITLLCLLAERIIDRLAIFATPQKIEVVNKIIETAIN